MTGIGSESPRTTMYKMYNFIKRMVRDGRAGILNLSEITFIMNIGIKIENSKNILYALVFRIHQIYCMLSV